MALDLAIGAGKRVAEFDGELAGIVQSGGEEQLSGERVVFAEEQHLFEVEESLLPVGLGGTGAGREAEGADGRGAGGV